MDFKTYMEQASRTCAILDSKEQDNLHMVLGMLTEAGELADVFKKELAYNKPIDWVNVSEEIFDIMWYIANFCRINEIDCEKGLEINIAKLRARYPEKFTEENANNRDLEKERKILEQ
jgi:NTP pyrophosphatase (non-canonical NTP hydrolase)